MAVWLPKPRSLARPLPLALLPLRRHFTLTKVESSTTENFAPGGLKGKARRQRRSLRAAAAGAGASASAGPDPPRRDAVGIGGRQPRGAPPVATSCLSATAFILRLAKLTLLH